MDGQCDFRALLLKIQDLLSDNDRHRLHFLLGEDIPRYLRDDPSVSGALRVLESLLEKAIISHQDCEYLIGACKRIQCHDAARRLQEYQQSREKNKYRSSSLQAILLQDNEDDKICCNEVPAIDFRRLSTEVSSTSLEDIPCNQTQTTSFPLLQKSLEQPIKKSRWMDFIFMSKLNLRERLLVALIFLLIIINILTLSVLVGVMTTKPKSVLDETVTTTKKLRNPHWAKIGEVVAGGHGEGAALKQFHNPNGIFIDDNQTMFIADMWNHRIIQWKLNDTEGKVVAGNGSEGNQSNQLNSPSDVVIHKETYSLIICDRDNKRVVRWSRLANTVEGETLLNNIACYGVAVDHQGNFYVSDTENHAVRRYRIGDRTGKLVAGGHGNGSSNSQLNNATHIFVDRNQTLYISDSGNHRVMKWIRDAEHGTIVAEANNCGIFQIAPFYPRGLFVDAMDTLYVVDESNHRVLRWPKDAKQGFVIVDSNQVICNPNLLESPIGLSLDLNDNLYVVDAMHDRVQYFSVEYTNS